LYLGATLGLSRVDIELGARHFEFIHDVHALRIAEAIGGTDGFRRALVTYWNLAALWFDLTGVLFCIPEES
jgi:hypothetical protein